MKDGDLNQFTRAALDMVGFEGKPDINVKGKREPPVISPWGCSALMYGRLLYLGERYDKK